MSICLDRWVRKYSLFYHQRIQSSGKVRYDTDSIVYMGTCVLEKQILKIIPIWTWEAILRDLDAIVTRDGCCI